jgi:iron complex outermembrane receptor protein
MAFGEAIPAHSADSFGLCARINCGGEFMKVGVNKATAALVALVSGLGSALPAKAGGADPAEANTAGDLSEIIVTARRVEERIQDVPISMTVLSQEQLSNRNIVNASDLANITPSLSVNNNFGNENASFAIRGFVQDAGTAPSVGTYFADVVAPRGPTQGTQAGDSAGPGSFFDLQNVQILKGPQGTLFGRNTTGGAVLLVPQKPNATFGGYGEVSGGNFGMWRTQGAINVPFGESIRFRLAADHQTRDGYVHNISGIGASDYNNVNYTAVRASLVVDVTANVENYTIGSYSNSSTNGSVEKPIACNPAGYNPVNPLVGFANFIGGLTCGQLASESARGAGFYDVETAIPDPLSRIEQWQLINTTTWSVADSLTLKNIASYAEFKDLQRAELFATNWNVNTLPQPYPSIFFLGAPAIFAEINAPAGGESSHQRTYTEELQAQGSVFAGRLTYQGGVYLEWSDPIGTYGNSGPQLANCTDVGTFSCTDPLGAAFTAISGRLSPVGAGIYTVGRTTYRDQGVYAQSSYSITDQFKLTGGLRYTHDEASNDTTRMTYNFPVTPPFVGPATVSCTDPGQAPSCLETLRTKSGRPTWMIDLDYKPIEDVLIYGKYARGYRAGGVYPNGPSDHRTFQPEQVDNYEVGVKTSFQSVVRGTFNFDGFYNNFTNQQLQAGFNPRVDPVTGDRAPVGQTAAIVNAGKSRIYGVEVQSSINPVTGLTMALDYTYLRTQIRQINSILTNDPNYQPQNINIAIGSPLALSPENKYTLSANYRLPLSKSIGDIVVGANYVHVDEQLTNYVYQVPAVTAAIGRNYNDISSRDLLNADIEWNSIAGLPLDVSVFGTNLADKKYYEWIPGLGPSGLELATLGAPRMYGVRVRYRFGE